MITSKDNCCGCSACISICPKKAISMETDEKGFNYPIVDKKICINCELCKKVCPIKNTKEQKSRIIKAYACYNKNEKRRIKSSSGGIFILLAKEIIKRNGVVFGAEFDENFKVKHNYTEQESKLANFMGAKYVQSEIGDTYKIVKKFLLQDRYVLFTGTPCQIEGLKNYLQKDYEKLYTQDIICHGVPSPLVWEKYKQYRAKKDGNSPINISFRNKDKGWKLYNIKFSYIKDFYLKDKNEDLYMKAFLKNTSLRDSCYNCKFKKKNRYSDFTLGDYWEVNNIHPEFNDDKGVSLVVINSKKGEELFANLKEELVYVETDINKAIKYNKAYLCAAQPDPNREKFFENINNINFCKLVKKYTKHSSIFKRIFWKIKKIVRK